MKTITLTEAQTSLADIVHRLIPGERITLTENNAAVAELVAANNGSQQPVRPRPAVTGVPRAGRWKGKLVVPRDFDEPLEELREYME